jgi:hypothetical protein
MEALVGALVTFSLLYVLLEVLQALFKRENKMPVAVVTEENHRKELKSLEGAFVVVREMTYGERLVRQGMNGKMRVLAGKSEFAGELEMATRQIALWDFANLIVEHNLQDKDERVLNFRVEKDVEKLASKIGDEVGAFIDEINSFEDIEEGNS